MRGAFQLIRRSRDLIGSMKSRDGIAALLTVAIIMNVLQFNNTVKKASHKARYKAFPQYATADITKIAEASVVPVGYGLYFELGRRFPGSTIILPRSGELGREFKAGFLSYGRAERVALATYEAEDVLSGLEYERFIVAQGKYRRKREPFVIAAGSDPKAFLFLRAQGKTILLDRSLLSQAGSKPRD